MAIHSLAEIIEDQMLIAAEPSTPLHSACMSMSVNKVGALAVVSKHGLVGIISASDIIGKAICGRLKLEQTTVGDVMTPNPQTAEASASPSEALDLMTRGGFHHLPVTRNGRVAGMISIQDIPALHQLMQDKQGGYMGVVGMQRH